MRQFSSRYETASRADVLRPRYTIVIDFGQGEPVYFTTQDALGRPSGANAYDGSIVSFRGATQKINPRSAASSIGSITFDLQDNDGEITALFAQKNNEGKSLREKIVRVFYGYGNFTQSNTDINGTNIADIGPLDWVEYEQYFTMLIKSYSINGSVISIQAEDVQRLELNDLFAPNKSQLVSTIDADQLFIPLSENALSAKFQTIEHDASYSDLPSQAVGYVRIDKEVIAHAGLVVDETLGVGLNVIQRGALNTDATAHVLSGSGDNERKIGVDEFIYLEGPALKLLYAIQTGVLYGQSGATLPAHWHHGIPTSLVRLNDYLNADPLLWQPQSNRGRKLIFRGLTKQNGEKFIRSEILSWLGGFRPIYADGAIGFKKLSGVLTGSDYVYQLDRSNIVSHGALQHDLNEVVNDIAIDWDYSFTAKKFIQDTRLLDVSSIRKYGNATPKRLAFKGVTSSSESEQNLRAVFDAYRNRYAGGGMRFDAELMPHVNALEVGDIARVRVETVTDPLTGKGLDRIFEVQQVTPANDSGRVRVALFASTDAAGEFEEITVNAVLPDAFYVREGTPLASVATMSGNTITADVTLQGGDTLGEGIFYHDGDVIIPAGVTVTILNNVQLRIKGFLTRIGDIIGKGKGHAGGQGGDAFIGTVPSLAGPVVINSGGLTHAWDIGLLQPSDPPPFPLGSPPDWRVLWGQLQTNETLGASGYIGQSQASRFAIVTGNSEVFLGGPYFDAPLLTGNNTRVERLPLINRNNEELDGLSRLDLRGSSGNGSRPLLFQEFANGPSTYRVVQPGVDGGNGGAGLMIVCRGESVGASSVIDLSGENGTHPPLFPLRDAVANAPEKSISNGGSGGGQPGAYYLLIDGNKTFGTNTSNVKQERGLAGLDANAQAFASETGEVINPLVSNRASTVWRDEDATDLYPIHFGRALTPPVDMGDAGFRVQFIPVSESRGQRIDVDNDKVTLLPIASPITLRSGGNENLLLAKDGSIRELMRVTWTATTDTRASQYEVQAKLSTQADSKYRTVAYVDRDKPEAVIDVTAGERYIVRVRVISRELNTVSSAFVTSNDHQVIGKTQIPSMPQSLFLFIDPLQGVIAQVSAHPAVDFYQFIVSVNDLEVARSPLTTINLGFLPSGTHSVAVSAIDRSGNIGTAIVDSVTLGGIPVPPVSVRFEGENAVLSFARGVGDYQEKTFKVYYQNQLLSSADDNVFTTKVTWQGARTFRVSVDYVSGARSVLSDVTVDPARPSRPVFSYDIVNNNVVLNYRADVHALPIKAYEIRRGSDFAAPIRSDAQAGDSSSVTLALDPAAGEQRFWCVAIDSAGNRSDAASLTVPVTNVADIQQIKNRQDQLGVSVDEADNKATSAINTLSDVAARLNASENTLTTLAERVDIVDTQANDNAVSLSSTVQTVNRVETELNTANQTASALAQQVQSIRAKSDSNTVSLSVQSQAIIDIENGVVARWAVKTNVNDLEGGIGFLNNGTETVFRIDANKTLINGVMQSVNYSQGSAGTKINWDTGEAEFNTVVANQYVEKNEADTITPSMLRETATGSVRTSDDLRLQVVATNTGAASSEVVAYGLTGIERAKIEVEVTYKVPVGSDWVDCNIDIGTTKPSPSQNPSRTSFLNGVADTTIQHGARHQIKTSRCSVVVEGNNIPADESFFFTRVTFPAGFSGSVEVLRLLLVSTRLIHSQFTITT